MKATGCGNPSTRDEQYTTIYFALKLLCFEIATKADEDMRLLASSQLMNAHTYKLNVITPEERLSTQELLTEQWLRSYL